MGYKQAKRDLVKYGRRTELKLSYRQTSAGSDFWGPWHEQRFPLNGSCERNRYVIGELLDYLVNQRLTSDDVLLALAFKRKKLLSVWIISELMKKDISLKELVLKDFREWRPPTGEENGEKRTTV